MITNENLIKELKRDIRDLESLRKVISGRKNRLQADQINPKTDNILGRTLENGKSEPGLVTIKGRLVRNISKNLLNWPIYTDWIMGVPGLGPRISGALILQYYYIFNPVCKKCGKSLELRKGLNGDGERKAYICSVCNAVSTGMLKHEIGYRDFPNISKWWTFAGRGDPEFKKRRKGMDLNDLGKGGSPRLKETGYQIAESFIKKKNEYYTAFYLPRKEKRARINPEWSKGKIDAYSKNEMVKLFLAHFWQVAREIEELPVTQPYAGTILGHTGIIQPFYWNTGG